MKASLLDVNVLVALAWPNHVHHDAAHAWLDRHRAAGWATCPVSQAGFVRVSSNPRVVPDARTPAEVLEVLASILEQRGHSFWIDDISFPGSPHVARKRIVGHAQVTDAHLLAVALRHRGRLATFDDAIRGLVPPGVAVDDAVVVVPV